MIDTDVLSNNHHERTVRDSPTANDYGQSHRQRNMRSGFNPGRVGKSFLSALVGLTLLGNMVGVAAAASGDGVARKSMFVDLGASPPREIAYRVGKICEEHRDPNADSYIQDVVLVGMVDGTGQLRVDQLNAVLPHVPGGGGELCFDNVFIGPAHPSVEGMPWKERPDFPPGLEPWCADSPYCGGILTDTWRWDNIQANREGADLFLGFANENYPGIRPNLQWYITYEAYFDWLGDNSYAPRLRSAYEAYLLQTITEYRDALVAAGEPEATASRAVLWSPAYENEYQAHSTGQLETIRASLRSMFRNVADHATARGITRGLDWLHMQDRIGQTGCFEPACYEGVKSWYEFLSTVNHEDFSFASLRVNMEGFSPGSSRLGDPAEQKVRQNYYESNGIPIGASWELTWWLNAVPPPEPPDPPSHKPPKQPISIPKEISKSPGTPGFF